MSSSASLRSSSSKAEENIKSIGGADDKNQGAHERKNASGDNGLHRKLNCHHVDASNDDMHIGHNNHLHHKSYEEQYADKKETASQQEQQLKPSPLSGSRRKNGGAGGFDVNSLLAKRIS